MIIKFGHTADNHFTERSQIAGQYVLGDDGLNVRLTDAERCINALADGWDAAGALFALFCGDVFDQSKPTPNEEKVAHRAIDRIARKRPVFLMPGNHDANGPLEAPGVVSFCGRPGIHVALVPGYWDIEITDDAAFSTTVRHVHPFRPLTAEPKFDGHGIIRIFALPWPSRAQLMGDDANAKLTAAELNAEVSRRLAAIVSGMRALHCAGPNILMFHGTMKESHINEQPAALEADIGLSVTDLVGFDYIALGHVHERQEFDIGGGGVAAYPGGSDRFAHGEETEDKGGNLVTIKEAEPGIHQRLTHVELVRTPARPFRTHTVDEVIARGVLGGEVDDGWTVHRVVGAVAPAEVAALRARLAEQPVRFLKHDFEVTRQTAIREPMLKENWTTDALVRQRLEARGNAGERLAKLLDLHSQIVAEHGTLAIQRIAGERPLELELTNFGPYAHAVLDFESLGDSACIVGPNGAGKTTLIEAMLFAKTGQCRVNQDQQIRRGEKQASVRYVWAQGERRFRITRTIDRRTKRGSSLVTLAEIKGGEWVPFGDGATAEAEIEKTTGSDYDVATSTSFCLDTGGGDLLRARPADRIRIAKKIFGGEEFTPWKEAADAGVAKLEITITPLAAEHERANQDLLTAEVGAGKLDELRARAAAAAEREEEAQVALAAARAEVARLRALEGQKADLLKTVKSATDEETAAVQLQQRVKARMEQADRIASTIVEARAGVESLKWSKVEVDDALDIVTAAKMARADAENAERAHQRVLQEALSAVHQAERELDAATAQARRDRDTAITAARERVVAAEAQERHDKQRADDALRFQAQQLKQIDAQILDHRNRVKVLEQVPCGGAGEYATCGLIGGAKLSEVAIPGLLLKQKSLCAAPAGATWEDDEKPSNAPDLAALRAALEAAKADTGVSITMVEPGHKVEQAKAALKEIGIGPSAKAAVTAHEAAAARYEKAMRDQNELAGWPAALERAEQAAAEVTVLADEITAAGEAVARAAERKETARATLLAAQAESADAALAQAASCRADVDLAQRDGAGARADVTIAERQRDRLPDLRVAVEAIAIKLAEHQEHAKLFGDLSSVYGEIPMLLIDSGGVAVQEVANAMLAAMHVPERVRIDTIGRNKSNANTKDTFDIWVTDRNGYEAIFECYSRGERFGVDLSLRRAMGEMQAARAASNDPPPLMIDEGWGSLDEERRRIFPDVLRRVIETKVFSVVLTVSHVKEVIDTFRTLLVINQTPEGSVIQVVRK